MEHNPWKTLRSRVVYENDWIRLREDQVIRPDGNPGIYGVVETRIATASVALADNGDVYLVGQYRYATDEYSWEVIQGGADPGESPLEAAKRELQEEAGLIAEQWEQIGGEIHTSNCFTAERGFAFLATGLKETATAHDPTEVLQIRRVPLKDAIAMIDRGEIKDGITIISLLQLARVQK